MTAATAWQAGRFDSKVGPKRILFGQMYEDTEIERAAFRPGGRIFCIASAGSTALNLCDRHEIVACDINPAQLAYAERRIAGAPIEIGTAEKVMGFGRSLAPLAGWRTDILHEFLALATREAQLAFWDQHLDTWRFRTGFDAMLSFTGLRVVYGTAFLDFLPPHFGAVLRARMRRGFALHANAENRYARALLLGACEPENPAVPTREASRIRLVLADAASFLERCAPGSFDGFTLSNILDGAEPTYRARLMRAVERAGAKDAVVVLRSFGEPKIASPRNQADRDRSMLWGIVDVHAVHRDHAS